MLGCLADKALIYVVCKLVSFLMPWKHGYGSMQS